MADKQVGHTPHYFEMKKLAKIHGFTIATRYSLRSVLRAAAAHQKEPEHAKGSRGVQDRVDQKIEIIIEANGRKRITATAIIQKNTPPIT